MALFLLAALGASVASGNPARAADEAVASAPAPRRSFLDGGRLLATTGATSLEGAGGGGLAPWALITGHGSRDGVGANVHGTGVRLPDFSLWATGIGVGIADRVELSYQHQWFDTGKAGARLGLGRGYTFEQDVFGAKLRLFGDVVADQDRPWPQVSVGLQHKRSANGDVVRAVGARDASGTDFYSYCVIFCCRAAWSRRQQGHRGKLLTSATARRRRMLAIECGTCRSGRTGGAARLETLG
jgi:hypothetical protein